MNRGKRKYDPLVKEENPYANKTSGLPYIHNARVEDAKSQQMAQDAVCMHELLQEYGITEGEAQWFQLALALARDYVPEFKMETGARGRRTKWTQEKLRQLYDDVQDKIQSSGKNSESEACMHVKQKYGMKHAALISQYKKAKRLFAS